MLTSHQVGCRVYKCCTGTSRLIYLSDRYPNVYGIDMPSRTELVAHGRTEQEICDHIGADLAIFQTLPDLIASCTQFNPAIEKFECSVFSGEYISGGVNESYLGHIEQLRADHIKAKNRSAAGVFVEQPSGCSGPLSGSEANIGVGLADSRPAGIAASHNKSSDCLLGLSNSDGTSADKEDAKSTRSSLATAQNGA